MSELYLFIACVSTALSGLFWFISGVTSEADGGKATWWVYAPALAAFLTSVQSVAMAYLAGSV